MLVFIKPLAKIGQILYSFFDKKVIENVVNGIPETLYTGTSVVSDTQTGLARNYLKSIFISIIIFGLILFI